MVENDCEDQGLGRISDGCANCRTDEVVIRNGVEWLKPVALEKRERHGTWWWVCPCCCGSYGAVT